MGKFPSTKKLNKGLQVCLVSKLQCGQVKLKIKKPEIGKPAGLSKISLQQPNIWSTQKRDINVLSFLMKEGRHFLLHFAGAKKNLKSEQDEYKRMIKQEKYNEQKSNQPLYEFLESFSENYLGNPQRNKKKERIVVFFFRNNSLLNLKNRYPKKLILQNQQWNLILKGIKFLLDETFYQELIEILKKLEDKYDVEHIADDLIQTMIQTKNLQDIQEIFKNLLIQIFKGRSDLLLYWDKIQNLSSDQIFKIYKERIILYKNQIMKFINNVKTLFEGESLDSIQDFQYEDTQKDQFEESNYQQRDSLGYSIINFHSEEL